MRITSDGAEIVPHRETKKMPDPENLKIKIHNTRDSFNERQITIQKQQNQEHRNAEAARDKQRENINNMKKLSPTQMHLVEYGMEVSEVLELDRKKGEEVYQKTKGLCEKYERMRVMNDWLWFMIFGDCEDQLLMLSRYSNLLEMVEFCIDDFCQTTNAMSESCWSPAVIRTLRKLALPQNISVDQWTEKLEIARSMRAHRIMMNKTEAQKTDKMNTVIKLRDSLNKKQNGAGNKYEESYRRTPDINSNESITDYVCVNGEDVRGVLTLLCTNKKIPVPSLHKKDVEDILLAYMLAFTPKFMEHRLYAKDPGHRFAFPANTWEYFCGTQYGPSLMHGLNCLVDSRPLYDRGRPLLCKGMVILIRSYPMYVGVYNGDNIHSEKTDEEIRESKRQRGEKGIVYVENMQ